MARVLRVYCPKCERDYETLVTDDVIRAARESLTGITGIVDIHDDHALVIFVDAHGSERGVRVYTILPREVELQRLSIPEKYLEGLERIAGFSLKLASRGLLIEGRREEGIASVRVSIGDSELDLSLKGSGDVEKVGKWGKAFLKGVEEGASLARLDTLLLALKVLDACMDRPVPSYAHRAFRLITACHDVVVKLSEEEDALFETYIGRLGDLHPRSSLVYVLRSAGKTLFEVFRDKDPAKVYELLECGLALERRGIIRFEEVAA